MDEQRISSISRSMEYKSLKNKAQWENIQRITKICVWKLLRIGWGLRGLYKKESSKSNPNKCPIPLYCPRCWRWVAIICSSLLASAWKQDQFLPSLVLPLRYLLSAHWLLGSAGNLRKLRQTGIARLSKVQRQNAAAAPAMVASHDLLEMAENGEQRLPTGQHTAVAETMGQLGENGKLSRLHVLL